MFALAPRRNASDCLRAFPGTSILAANILETGTRMLLLAILLIYITFTYLCFNQQVLC